MPFRCLPPPEAPVKTILHHPWEMACAPFQVAKNTWYVSGQTWVASYLIQTGDGLILIDTGIPESLYLLINSIYALGFNPRDIKKILISHAHFDHCGGAAALQKLTGAAVYLSKEDACFMEACPDEVFYPREGSHVQKFSPDYLYDGRPITLGDVCIETRLTPGHTPGCTSFFWSSLESDGARYQIGMHGGIGANTMNDEYYKVSRGMTYALRKRFLADIPSLLEVHVDIALPSHPNQIDILSMAGSYSEQRNPFIDPSVWSAFLKMHFNKISKLEICVPGSGGEV